MSCIEYSTCSMAVERADFSPVSNSAQAEEFKRLVADDPLAEHVYEAGPASFNSVPSGVDSLIRQLQGFANPGGHPTAVAADAPDSANTDLSVASYEQQILSAQASLLKAQLMMEMVSSAKQGVSTLFQQQG